MTHEIITTDWFDAAALRLPNYKVGRVNFAKGRSYIKIEEDGIIAKPFRLYTSLTTAIAQSMPMPQALEDWKFQHGKKEADRLTNLQAHYGTMLHLEIGRFLRERIYDLDSTDTAVETYTSAENFWEKECDNWPTILKEDMLAFMQFFFDYKVEPLGIEFVLLSDNYGFGTLIDLVCHLTIEEPGLDYLDTYKSGPRNGEPREIKVPVKKRAIINFKSGRKGFYETHGIQIEAEKQLWEENFPDLPIDMACNWAPADWKTNPGYKLKTWEDAVSQEEVTAIMKLAEIRYRDRAEKRKYMKMSGIVSTLDSLVSAIQYEDVEDYCNRKFGNTPEVSKADKAKAAQALRTKASESKPIAVVVPKPMTSLPLPI
ncbi:MAG: hypothetical protein Q8R83_05950 [Legionellaceae bacterium]|nr:hypothetical protein [Legionellaceae bacterium]